MSNTKGPDDQRRAEDRRWRGERRAAEAHRARVEKGWREERGCNFHGIRVTGCVRNRLSGWLRCAGVSRSAPCCVWEGLAFPQRLLPDSDSPIDGGNPEMRWIQA